MSDSRISHAGMKVKWCGSMGYQSPGSGCHWSPLELFSAADLTKQCWLYPPPPPTTMTILLSCHYMSTYYVLVTLCTLFLIFKTTFSHFNMKSLKCRQAKCIDYEYTACKLRAVNSGMFILGGSCQFPGFSAINQERGIQLLYLSN